MIAWPAFDLSLAAAAGVVVLAYTVYGLTGFGSSIIAVPLLTQLLPLRQVVPMMLVFDLFGGVMVGLRNRSDVDWHELRRIAPFILVGMLGGLTLLVSAPQRPLLLVLGLFIFAYALWTLVLRPPVRPISAWWGPPVALVGGVFTTLFGTGGAVYAAFLARRVARPQALRASISVLLLGTALVRLVLFSSVGLYRQPMVLPRAALLLPGMLCGLWLGSRLHHKLPPRRVIQAVWVVLLASGAGLLVRNL